MKRSAIKRRPMADSVLKSLEPEEQDYQEKDSPGLYFRVKKRGHKSWTLRYKRPNGKWAWLGLGGFPAVSGKAARDKAVELLKLASDGKDLKEYLAKFDTHDRIFDEVAEIWFERMKNAGRSANTLKQMRRYIDGDMKAVLKGKAISEITRGDCLAVQQRLEKREAHNISKKVRGWLSKIFSMAVAESWLELNPASELRHVAVTAPKTKHYPHLLEPELPDFLQALRRSPSREITKHLIWLVLRTSCRPGMARNALWEHFDLKGALWTIPEEEMKSRREHLIPLSKQTVSDLHELHELTGRSPYLFPGNGSVNPVLSENTLNQALMRIGYKDRLVGHGSRHTASTLLREHGWEKQFVESHLAHIEKGVAGVYNKAQYLKPRQKMVQWYADYLEALEKGTKAPDDPAG